jgi:hypothetical protein
LVLGHLDAQAREFPVRLTMQQVKDSPDIDTDRPVSRQMETNVYDYYGWRPYWGGGLYMGGYGYLGGATMAAAPAMEPRRRDLDVADTRHDDDPHLRSVAAVTGYHVHASDGEVGHVEDFLVEDVDWSIHYVVVDTKKWWPGKKVLISPWSARDIDWANRLVNLDVARQKVKNGPAYDASVTVDRAYETHFRDYYSDPPPQGRA